MDLSRFRCIETFTVEDFDYNEVREESLLTTCILHNDFCPRSKSTF